MVESATIGPPEAISDEHPKHNYLGHDKDWSQGDVASHELNKVNGSIPKNGILQVLGEFMRVWNGVKGWGSSLCISSLGKTQP